MNITEKELEIEKLRATIKSYQDVNQWIVGEYKKLDSPKYPMDAALVSKQISKGLADVTEKLKELENQPKQDIK
jgi:hypothetical protein